MTSSRLPDPAPLVTRAALEAFTQRLVEHFAPQKVILFGSQARGEALDHGELLHGELDRGTLERPGVCTPVRNPVVQEWIERAERPWRMAELLPDLPPGYLSGLFQVQRCLETYLRAALIAQPGCGLGAGRGGWLVRSRREAYVSPEFLINCEVMHG